MRKLTAYSTSAAAFIALANAAQGQIVYQNIDPDLVTDDERIFLDVNADGEFDIWFDLFHSGFFGAQYTSAYAGNQNPYVQLATNGLLPGAQGLKNFAEGEIIDSVANWETPAPFFGDLLGRLLFFDYYSCEDMLVYFPYGEFVDVSNGILAFKIEDAGENYYGWVRLNVPQSPVCPLPLYDALTIVVHDYAIQNTPNAPIAAGVVGCDTPENPEAEAAATAIKVSWDAADGATEYKIQYRPVGALSWETKTALAPKTARIIKGLDCNTTYEYQIASICDGIVSAFTSIQTISTIDCKIGDMPLTASLLIYPNPATDVITINIDEDIVAYNISVTDLQGNIVLQRNLPTNSIAIDISGLANGTYIIIAQTSEGLQHAYFVKQ